MLNNKTAIITGAGKGIGKATAIKLASEGVNLGLIARTAGDLEQLKKELEDRHGVRVYTTVADISVQEQVNAAITVLIEQLGSVDILVNSAGIADFGTVLEMDSGKWESIIQTNLFGTYYACRAVLPAMMGQNEGNIINISSTAGEKGFANGSAYCASKFAVMGLTEALMQEVRKSNIRVTALTPSTVNTGMAVGLGLKIGDEDHMMQPEDVAELIVAGLKLPQRVLLKSAGLWTTNPA